MQIDISITPTIIPRRLWWILPDAVNSTRNGVPMTCQFRPTRTIPFTPKLQWFIRGLNDSGDPTHDNAAFAAYRDTWNTAGGKIRDHYNAITGEGDPNDLPALELNIGFKANHVSGVEEISDGTIGIPKGTPVLRMITLDPDHLPETISYFGNEHVIHHQMIVQANVIDGQRQRNPFIQMGGRILPPFMPCLTALISPIPLYIEMDKLVEVTDIQNPYNPPWEWQ